MKKAILTLAAVVAIAVATPEKAEAKRLISSEEKCENGRFFLKKTYQRTFLWWDIGGTKVEIEDIGPSDC